jgi:hypothetical protein
MYRNHIRRKGFLGLALALFVAHSSVGQQESAAIPQAAIIPPSPINSTFEIKDPVVGVRTIRLHEEDGQLTMDETTKVYGVASESMKYEKVNYAGAEEDDLRQDAKKTVVRIGAADGTLLIITLRTEMEAKAVADYVGRKCSLDFIGDAWRVRKPFQCPNNVGPAACQSFKELLDHDDLSIVDFYYSQATQEHRYVCFSEGSTRFFLITSSDKQKFGHFYQEAFEDGQSTDLNVGAILNWVDDFGGEIISVGRKPRQRLGTVDASSLAYQKTFTNTIGTATEYKLNIRWSTGRYTESHSWKDNKGKPLSHEESGICVRLN